MNADISTSPIPVVADRKVPSTPWSELTAFMRTQPMWVSIFFPVLLTIVMGWLDDITGWEVSLFIFYAIPIIQAVWWGGVNAGVIITILSGLVWWYANLDVHPYETLFGYVWAMINREFYFLVVVFAVSIVRKKQDADAEYIRVLEERQQLEKDIVAVSEYEQQRIGRDLHDGLCQQLAAIGCAARALTEDLQSKGLEHATDASAIEDSLRQAVVEARDMARGIFPVHVDRSGLSTALRDLAQTTARLTNIDIQLIDNEEVQLSSPEISMHLYRIAQEAVANAVRHASPHHIWIKIERKGGKLHLTVEDDGRGIDVRLLNKSDGMGLRTMRYRAQSIGASLEIEPRPKGGNRVYCCLRIDTEPSSHG